MFYKLISKDMCNRSYQFKIGLNVLNEPFNPANGCQSGGFYFCNLDDLGFWLFLYPNGLVFEVTVPENAVVVKQYKKYKADQIYINNPMNIPDFIQKYNVAESYLKSDFRNLQHINLSVDYSRDLYLRAIKSDGHLLAHIPEHMQTTELCLAAVNQNGNALIHVKVQTPCICLAAVKQNGNALRHVKVQTTEICLAAVKQNGYALIHVKTQTLELCLAAVKQNCYAVSCVKFRTPEICSIVLEQNNCLNEYIINDYS